MVMIPHGDTNFLDAKIYKKPESLLVTKKIQLPGLPCWFFWQMAKKDYFEIYQPVWVSSRIFVAVFFVSRLTMIMARTEIIKA